jgi:hypothetical protein
MSPRDTQPKALRTGSRPALRLRLLLLPFVGFAVSFLIAQALADEPITVEGQFDSGPLADALTQSGLKGASEAANTISLQFPKEGGPVTGDFALEFENFPIGAVLVGVGQAITEGVAGTITGAFGGEAGTPESGPPPTPTPKERILLTCTSTLSLTGTLTGTYDAATGRFTGNAEVTGSVYEDLRCSEPIPGLTDAPRQTSVATSTWEATFDGERQVTGVIAPASEGATPLAFQAEVLAPEMKPDQGAGGTTPAETGKPSTEGGAATVGETGLASRVMRPGSRMPPIENTAAASAFLAATATLMSVGVLRQPRTPRAVEQAHDVAGAATAAAQYVTPYGPNVTKWLEGRTEAAVQRNSHNVLRRLGLSRSAIAEIGSDAPRVAANLLSSAPNINVLAGNVRNELLSNERLAHQVLRDCGLTPIQIRLLGGPRRIVRNTERLLRNPPRAIGEFLGDTFMNLRRPDRLIKRAGRAVLDSNPVTGFIGRAFGLFGMR